MNILKQVERVWSLYRIFIIILVLAIIGLFILNMSIPSYLPMKNRPSEITVYKYGKEKTYQSGEQVFNELFKRLRPCAKAKVTDLLTRNVTMASIQAPDSSFMNEFQQYGIVVKVVYDNQQHIHQEGYAIFCHEIPSGYFRAFSNIRSPRKAVDDFIANMDMS